MTLDTLDSLEQALDMKYDTQYVAYDRERAEKDISRKKCWLYKSEIADSIHK